MFLLELLNFQPLLNDWTEHLIVVVLSAIFPPTERKMMSVLKYVFPLSFLKNNDYITMYDGLPYQFL